MIGMTKHIFIPRSNKFVNYAEKYNIDPRYVFVDSSMERIMEKDVIGMMRGVGYEEIVIHDLNRELNIKITHERVH